MKNIINFLVGILLTLIIDILFTGIVLAVIYTEHVFENWGFDQYFYTAILLLCINGLWSSAIVRDIFKEEY